jgi:hypothetical protein
MLVELKQCFMEAYDDNQDGKIDIREVSVWKVKYSVSATSIMMELIWKLRNTFPCQQCRRGVTGGRQRRVWVCLHSMAVQL